MAFHVVVRNDEYDTKLVNRSKFAIQLNKEIEFPCDYLVGVTNFMQFYKNPFHHLFPAYSYNANDHFIDSKAEETPDEPTKNAAEDPNITTISIEKSYPNTMTAEETGKLKNLLTKYFSQSAIVTHVFMDSTDTTMKISVNGETRNMVFLNFRQLNIMSVKTMSKPVVGGYSFEIRLMGTSFIMQIRNLNFKGEENTLHTNPELMTAETDVGKIYIDGIYKTTTPKTNSTDNIIVEFTENLKKDFKLTTRIIAFGMSKNVKYAKMQLRLPTAKSDSWPDLRPTYPHVFCKSITSEKDWNSIQNAEFHFKLPWVPKLEFPGIEYISDKVATILGSSKNKYYLFSKEIQASTQFPECLRGCDSQDVTITTPEDTLIIPLHNIAQLKNLHNAFNTFVGANLINTPHTLYMRWILAEQFPKNIELLHPSKFFKISFPHAANYFTFTYMPKIQEWKVQIEYNDPLRNLISRSLKIPFHISIPLLIAEMKKAINVKIKKWTNTTEDSFNIKEFKNKVISINIPKNFKILLPTKLAEQLEIGTIIEPTDYKTPIWITSNICKDTYINNKLMNVLTPSPLYLTSQPLQVQYVPIRQSSINTIEISLYQNLEKMVLYNSTLATEITLHFIPDPYKHQLQKYYKLKRKFQDIST